MIGRQKASLASQRRQTLDSGRGGRLAVSQSLAGVRCPGRALTDRHDSRPTPAAASPCQCVCLSAGPAAMLQASRQGQTDSPRHSTAQPPERLAGRQTGTGTEIQTDGKARARLVKVSLKAAGLRSARAERACHAQALLGLGQLASEPGGLRRRGLRRSLRLRQRPRRCAKLRLRPTRDQVSYSACQIGPAVSYWLSDGCRCPPPLAPQRGALGRRLNAHLCFAGRWPASGCGRGGGRGTTTACYSSPAADDAVLPVSLERSQLCLAGFESVRVFPSTREGTVPPFTHVSIYGNR
jgi:hypothetical protein